MNNVGARYTAIARLIGNLRNTMERANLSTTKRSIFMSELVSLKRAMNLIKASQFFGRTTFIFNLLFVLATYLSVTTTTPSPSPIAIILMRYR